MSQVTSKISDEHDINTEQLQISSENNPLNDCAVSTPTLLACDMSAQDVSVMKPKVKKLSTMNRTKVIQEVTNDASKAIMAELCGCGCLEELIPKTNMTVTCKLCSAKLIFWCGVSVTGQYCQPCRPQEDYNDSCYSTACPCGQETCAIITASKHSCRSCKSRLSAWCGFFKSAEGCGSTAVCRFCIKMYPEHRTDMCKKNISLL
jgi:hypothetical protein